MGHATTIAKREWAGYFNTPVAYGFIIIFLFCMGFFTFNIGNFFENGQADLSQSFFVWHPWLYLILVPAVSMGLWAEERRNNTIELLFTLPITPLQAILGKFLGNGCKKRPSLERDSQMEESLKKQLAKMIARGGSDFGAHDAKSN